MNFLLESSIIAHLSVQIKLPQDPAGSDPCHYRGIPPTAQPSPASVALNFLSSLSVKPKMSAPVPSPGMNYFGKQE